MEKMNFIDRLHQEQISPGPSKRLEPEIILPPNTLDFQRAMQLVKEKNVDPFQEVTLDLSVAQSVPFRAFGAGWFLYAVAASDDGALVNVSFSDPDRSVREFRRHYGIEVPHSAVYLTWPAQAGKTLTLSQAPLSGLVQIHDHRKVSSISQIDEVSEIPGLNVYPAGAVKVNASGKVSLTATPTLLHTVTAGKALKVIASMFMGHEAGTGGTDLGLAVTDAADSIQYYIHRHVALTGSGNRMIQSALNHVPNLEIPAGYKVKIIGNASAYYAAAFQGYEVTI